MRRKRGSARRYAEAAFEIAERDGTLDAWLAELETAGEILGEPEVARLLANPAVPVAARAEAIRRALGDRLSEKARNLVLLLLRRGRIDLLPQVAQEFRALYEKRAGIVRATVISAAPLAEDEQRALRERLGQMTSGRVEMTVEVDPAILGGVIVRLGDRMIDGSVRGRLERLRSRLAAGAI
ncbi:MAG: F-type H+-transporting ATPase subunit delta [Chloroflexota bacterium]|jgi:F-type H+-transporting ATPase subunit delta|nr:F-type H+-transporting ATPase subunit delta [Chloroflexota bacterium]